MIKHLVSSPACSISTLPTSVSSSLRFILTSFGSRSFMKLHITISPKVRVANKSSLHQSEIERVWNRDMSSMPDHRNVLTHSYPPAVPPWSDASDTPLFHPSASSLGIGHEIGR